MMADIIFSLVLIVVSVVWIFEGVRLGLWIPGVSAGSGFIPAVFAALTLVSSLFVIYASFKKRRASAEAAPVQNEEEAKSDVTEKAGLAKFGTLVPVVFGVGGIVCLQLFGLVITVFAISFLWLMFVSLQGLKKSLLIAALVTLFIYMVFEFWLKIPFPGDIIKL